VWKRGIEGEKKARRWAGLLAALVLSGGKGRKLGYALLYRHFAPLLLSCRLARWLEGKKELYHSRVVLCRSPTRLIELCVPNVPV